MMNKSLRARRPESSRKRIYGFQQLEVRQAVASQKKAAVSGGF
jgi:hypothetical protein